MTRRRAPAIVATVLVGAAVGLAQCDREPVQPSVVDAPTPAPSAPQTALGRADIVAALAQAGSAYAGGGPTGTGQMIAGRSFEAIMPFGCAGPDGSAIAGLARWTWSQDRASISLKLTPDDLTRSPLVVRAGQTPTWDQVDGYWIARPWLAGDTCPRPVKPVPAAPVSATDAPRPSSVTGPVIEILTLPLPPSPQTAGLAVIRGADGSRLGRREGEAYDFVVRGSGNQPVKPPADGFRLVLSGRIGSFPDGQPIRCASDHPDRRPVCLAAVELDGVAFEDAAGNRLSEWRPN